MSYNNKPVIIYKGFGTRWNNIDLLQVFFKTELSINDFSVEFSIGEITKEYTNIQDGFAINLTAQETDTLPLGFTTGTIIVIDSNGNKKPFSTEIPFIIKDWEDGDIKLDGFKITINSKIQENSLTINIYNAIKNIEEYEGFNPSKIQTLKNIEGTIKWIDDE